MSNNELVRTISEELEFIEGKLFLLSKTLISTQKVSGDCAKQIKAIREKIMIHLLIREKLDSIREGVTDELRPNS